MAYIDYLKTRLQTNDILSLVEKAIEYLGDSQPVPHPDKKAYEIVDAWIEKVILKWNIDIKILRLPNSTFLGKLEPKREGFIINLNHNLFTTQKRFTLAHEIAHILSYDTSTKWPTYAVNHSLSEEQLCNRIARAILLPKNLLDLSEIDLSDLTREQINTIKRIWPEFKVSPWQIIKKIWEDGDYQKLVCIIWEHFPYESCLRIIDFCHLRGTFIPRHDRINLNTFIEKKRTNYSPEHAFNSNDIFQGFDTIEIGSLYKKNLFSTAFPIKTSAATYIIQVIRL